MHINVKNIILWQLIAQYFNLIISENRKNVVKSFPVRVFVPFTHPHPRLKCTSSAGLRSVIVVDKGDGGDPHEITVIYSNCISDFVSQTTTDILNDDAKCSRLCRTFTQMMMRRSRAQ